MPNHPREPQTGTAGEGFVDLDGRRFYRITEYDRLEPFFMTIVGAGDVWLFVSSTGGLTAGRVHPDAPLFPYYTDDKISESAGRTGGLSLLRVGGPGASTVVWEPFTSGPQGTGRSRRSLFKDVLGTALTFEEEHDAGLRLRVTWQTSSRFGVVRTSELSNTGDVAQEIEIIDGLLNVLPAGVETQVQNRLSNLLDAYKRSEVDPETGLGIFSLSSRLTDLAEPSESLHANVAWQVGLENVDHLVSARQLPAFRRGDPVIAEHDVRGQRGAYLIHTSIRLEPGESTTWSIVGDVEQDAADVVALRDLLVRPAEAERALREDLRANRVELQRILASADALQSTGDELATAHHLANVLFNVMRGGVPVNGYRIEAADLRRFIEQRSPETAKRDSGFLGGFPEELSLDDLLDRARAHDDPDLLRLSREYLPLTFSRRHGDPSRPWNSFRIILRDRDGRPRLNFEGNWRDIFQNWEALAWSFPEYLESMVVIFLDATTADGYNPYRISRDGVDWEVPEPDNPWANIGYWSDHQIIYLLRLMETSDRFHPGRLREMLDAAIFTHADVPYRLATYEQTIVDPHDTVSFDEVRAALIEDRVSREGADGRLVHAADGDLMRVTLAEKLLTLLLAKIVNLVPDGGIWMNTQRPEWNDANNALVGWGLSVVTLAQLHRYLEFTRSLLTEDVQVTIEVSDLLDAVTRALEEHRPHLERGFTVQTRRAFMDDLGAIGTAHRSKVYAGPSGRRTVATAAQLQQLLGTARSYTEASLRSNARSDGMFHSYNLLDVSDGGARIRRLPPMLEGQVAVLSSGQLTVEESLALLAGLRASEMFREDQHSYMLYPDRDVAGFLDRNRFPRSRAQACPLIDALLETGDRSLVLADAHGDLHFAAGIRNARDVESMLDQLETDPDLMETVLASREELLTIFGEVFNHADFTGRSGSFFAYEGLGSIYWHMVSKLLLAVQETLERAVADGAPATAVASLATAYEDVRAGLGYSKSAEAYGAFPTDPYSHTPAGHGARQPGMTGQVKEEVLTRLGELGLRVESGLIVFRPSQLRAAEWRRTPARFDYIDTRGHEDHLELQEGSLAFTFCQVPIVYRRSGSLAVSAHLADGSVVPCPDGRIPASLSESIFRRLGEVRLVEVHTAASAYRDTRDGAAAL